MRLPILILLIVFLSGAAAADVEPRINIEEISDQPAEPGDLVKVSVTVANDGTDEAEFGPVNVTTLENAEYVGTTSTLDRRFTLCGGCQQVGSVYVKITENAGSGSMPVKVTVPARDISLTETATIEIDGTAVITGSVSDATVPMGEQKNITVSIENIGSETASSASLQFTSGSFSFKPSTINLGSLEPGQKVDQEVVIGPDESLSSGTRRFNMTVSYTEDSERKSSSIKGSVNVVDRAELTLDEFEAADLKLGQSSTVSAEIENLGPGEAEKLQINMNCDGAEMSSTSAFVGQLGDGESIPASFKLTPENNDVSCQIDVGYEDNQMRSFTQTADFTASDDKSNIPLIAGIAIAVIVVIFFLYRRRRDELEEV